MPHSTALRPRTSLTLGVLCTILSAGCSTERIPADREEQPVIGGKVASPDDFPGVVALDMGGVHPECGGTLVAADWVLTAAHCIDPNLSAPVFAVIVGRYDLDTSKGEVRTVAESFVHPRYWTSTLDSRGHDVALLRLDAKTSGPLTRIVRSDQASMVAPDVKVTMAGWGLDGTGPSQRLLFGEVAVVDNATCYGGTPNNIICAGLPQGGVDSCSGDSGGPLYATLKGERVQVGITSSGQGCAEPNKPGTYTRLSDYLGWLYDVTGGLVGEDVHDSWEDTPAGQPCGSTTCAIGAYCCNPAYGICVSDGYICGF